MVRVVVFLVLIALAAAGVAWVADQTGEVTLTFNGWRIDTTLPVFVLGLGVVGLGAVVGWNILSGLWRMPQRVRRHRRDRRHARGRHAITHGLLAIGHGDSAAARQHADVARRLAGDDPLALLLHAQSAQLEGDRAVAKVVFSAMAEREDTRLLGLRGLFIEAQRADDAAAAVTIAEQALKLAPLSTWASHAVLGFRCAKGDWSAALKILQSNLEAGLIDKPTYRRQRGVLLTARALELENVDRDLSRASAMEAVRLAPALVPAAVLAAKFESEAHQIRRAMRIVEAAWLAQPHPDLADAYVHVRLGDSARERLMRAEMLAAKTPDHVEGALAVARAAIDAAEFGRAREALRPLAAAPTQRVAVLMAEIERTEHGDSGKARAWTLRAVRARHDPAWTADGYISEHWRPVSPVTGRLDAFQWQTPLASLPPDSGRTIETSPFEETMLAASAPQRNRTVSEGPGQPPRELLSGASSAQATLNETAEDETAPGSSAQPPTSTTDKTLEAALRPEDASKASSSAPAELPANAASPLFRPRADPARPTPPIPPVIPLVRPPDDPGVDEETRADEFSEQTSPPKAQAAGWRGFLPRWGG